jgi:hypothetical protein
VASSRSRANSSYNAHYIQVQGASVAEERMAAKQGAFFKARYISKD